MKKNSGIKLARRLCERSGMSRAVGILLILIILMCALIFVGYHLHNQKIAREIGCMTAMDSANKELAIAYLSNSGKLTKEEGIEAVGYAMNGWDDLCPGGGTVYMIDDPDGEIPYKIVCGMHDTDLNERTRVNANYVYEAVCSRVSKERAKGSEYPESVTVRLNGEDLVVKLVASDQKILRGTYLYDGIDDTVAFYSISGYGEFADAKGNRNGNVCYFCYADKDHCAVYTPVRGWYGDSWGAAAAD